MACCSSTRLYVRIIVYVRLEEVWYGLSQTHRGNKAEIHHPSHPPSCHAPLQAVIRALETAGLVLPDGPSAADYICRALDVPSKPLERVSVSVFSQCLRSHARRIPVQIHCHIMRSECPLPPHGSLHHGHINTDVPFLRRRLV
jgi:hypothetical protein